AAITCLAFSPDGGRAVSGSDDRTARIWETATGKELLLHEHEAAVTAVAFSSDGRTVVSGDGGNVTHVWEAATGKLLHRLPSGLEAPRGSRPAVCVLSFSPDGKRVWVGSRVFTVGEGPRPPTREKGELALYETATGRRVSAITRDDGFPMAV